MSVRYTRTARIEIDDTLARVAADNPASATAVAIAIKTAVGQLRAFPRIGSKTEQKGIYVKLARPYPYLIFYRIDGDDVVIRNVRHPARRRPPTL